MPREDTLPLPTPAAPHTAADAVFEKLIADIVSGTHAAGARLPAERDLARQLGASRPTLREALRRLTEWNLVTPRRGSGIVVRPHRDWMMEVLPAYLRYSKPKPGDPTVARLVGDLLELRRAMMVEVLRMCKGRVPSGGTASAREALALAWDHRDNGAEFARADLNVLRSVVDAARLLPGVWMINRISGIYCDLARSLSSVIAPPADYVQNYEKVLDALERHELDHALATLEDYLQRHDQRLLKLLEISS